jgi:hypothetical protein
VTLETEIIGFFLFYRPAALKRCEWAWFLKVFDIRGLPIQKQPSVQIFALFVDVVILKAVKTPASRPAFVCS